MSPVDYHARFASHSARRRSKVLTLTTCGHTSVRTLVQSGIDLYKVQQLLGHKSPTMTERYAHHFPESLRDGVEILDQRRDSSTKVAQSEGLDEEAVCVSS